MDNSRNGLPTYRRPPLVEMISGIQFHPLSLFKAIHFGLFGERMSGEYPTTEDQPELSDVVFGQQPQLIPQLIAGPIYPRVFYISKNGDFLLQVQRSKFLTNWRKQKDSDHYPRFSAAHQRFRKGWSDFVDFLSERKIGRPSARHYELQYVNHIVASTGDSKPPSPERYLRAFRADRLPAGVLSSMFLRLQLQMPNGKGTVDFTASPGLRASDQRQVLLLDLTARGPAQPDYSDIDDWFSTTHRFMVTLFTDITSEEAHREWELE